MHGARKARSGSFWLAAAALLAGAACEPAQQESEATWIEEPAELRIDYAIEVEDERSPEGMRRVAKDFRFRSGDRIQLALRPDFGAYVYLYHRAGGDRSYTALFPQGRIGVKNPLTAGEETRVPDGERRWTLDRKTGVEHLVLVVSSAPWEAGAVTGDKIGLDEFERRLAELEMARQPGSHSAAEEDGWTKLFFDGEVRDAALVARIPMSHL